MPNELNSPSNLSEPLVYQIRLKGQLGSEWADWFEGLTITLDEDGDTLLTGPGDRSGRIAWITQKSARSGNATYLGQLGLVQRNSSQPFK